MENHPIHTETRYDDLVGSFSVNFRENENLNTLAATVGGIDTQQYMPIAVRVYADKEVIMTIFAVDRMQVQDQPNAKGKLQMHKFKVGVSLQDLFSHFRQFDFTLQREGYRLEDFEIKEHRG